MSTSTLEAPMLLRSNPLRGGKPRVDFEGRVIRGCAIITRGEALGHGAWVDAEAVRQVAAMGAAMESGAGLKSRFTHPGMCADGTGKFLGRFKAFTVDGDIARADLNVSRASDNSPDGKLGQYTMDLADEDPEAFGTSIVFYKDQAAMDAFRSQNLDAQGRFVSPDPLNKQNLPHIRLASLSACDVVDDPAANPGGMFSAGDELAARGEALFSWLFGKSEQVPVMALGGLEPARVRTFFNGYLDRHGLAIVTKGTQMSTSTQPSQAPAAPAPIPEVKKLDASPDDSRPAPKDPEKGYDNTCPYCKAGFDDPDDPAVKKDVTPAAKGPAHAPALFAQTGLSFEEYHSKFNDLIAASGFTAQQQVDFRAKYFGKYPIESVREFAQLQGAKQSPAVGETGVAPSKTEAESAELKARFDATPALRAGYGLDPRDKCQGEKYEAALRRYVAARSRIEK